MERRVFMASGISLLGGLFVSCSASSNQGESGGNTTGNTPGSNSQGLYKMPSEESPHKVTWIAFVADENIWDVNQIAEVKSNLILIATTIAKYEPVILLANKRDIEEAKELILANQTKYTIEVVETELNDLWMRDIAPTFVKDSNGIKYALDFNFNGWGNKQVHNHDANIASFVAQTSKTNAIKSKLVLEGGCFEVDGAGTAIMTQSCIVNNNRNPNKTQAEIETELKNLLGLRKIIWLKGIKGKDITDGHTDFYARFAKPGVVVVSRDNYQDSFDYDVTRENIAILENATDADGNNLTLHIIDTPDDIQTNFSLDEFAAGYIGYYVCNEAIIMQSFGDINADEKAKNTLKQIFKNHHIEQISINGIASGGGSIHCATQQEPI